MQQKKIQRRHRQECRDQDKRPRLPLGGQEVLPGLLQKYRPEQGKYHEYNLVPEAGADYYASINFRISDWQKTNIRDTIAQQIGKQTRIDIAESTPTVLLLNGQYGALRVLRAL